MLIYFTNPQHCIFIHDQVPHQFEFCGVEEQREGRDLQDFHPAWPLGQTQVSTQCSSFGLAVHFRYKSTFPCQRHAP